MDGQSTFRETDGGQLFHELITKNKWTCLDPVPARYRIEQSKVVDSCLDELNLPTQLTDVEGVGEYASVVQKQLIVAHTVWEVTVWCMLLQDSIPEWCSEGTRTVVWSLPPPSDVINPPGSLSGISTAAVGATAPRQGGAQHPHDQETRLLSPNFGDDFRAWAGATRCATPTTQSPLAHSFPLMRSPGSPLHQRVAQAHHFWAAELAGRFNRVDGAKRFADWDIPKRRAALRSSSVVRRAAGILAESAAFFCWAMRTVNAASTLGCKVRESPSLMKGCDTTFAPEFARYGILHPRLPRHVPFSSAGDLTQDIDKKVRMDVRCRVGASKQMWRWCRAMWRVSDLLRKGEQRWLCGVLALAGTLERVRLDSEQ
ncbi:hypothetical protein EDB87DRAFT_1579945 [Lactarius vividus]|nr:hypothetical protein EDB87DRAFT_1579945 [Lactarius vividus]